MEPAGFPAAESATGCLGGKQRCAVAWSRQGQVRWNIRCSEEVAMPSEALKQVFSLEKAKIVAAWKVKTAFCSGSGEAEFPQEQQITKRRLLFISAKLGTVSSVSEVLGTKQNYSCWDAAHRCIAEKRQVTASWQYFLLHSQYADSAGCPACLCLFLCWAQPGVTQVRLHIDIQEAQRAFIYFLHVAERALKGACWFCMFGAAENKINVGTTDGFSVTE